MECLREYVYEDLEYEERIKQAIKGLNRHPYHTITAAAKAFKVHVYFIPQSIMRSSNDKGQSIPISMNLVSDYPALVLSRHQTEHP